MNAMLATLLQEVGGIDMDKEILRHWDTVSFTSLEARASEDTHFSSVALI
jgi:hypothetical protein